LAATLASSESSFFRKSLLRFRSMLRFVLAATGATLAAAGRRPDKRLAHQPQLPGPAGPSGPPGPPGPRAPGGPSLFEPLPTLVWDVHPSQAERVDGTLTVPLDPEKADGAEEDMPTLKIRFRMRPASTQPAPLGPMLVHQGGPGSGKEVIDSFFLPANDRTDPDLANQYDIFAIDQRGIGESEPNLAPTCGGATLPPYGSNPTASDFFPDCPCAGIPNKNFNFQGSEDAHLLQYFKDLETALDRCYASPHLQLGGHNVVDYIGTSYLAHDLDLLRKAIGADKLSIFGISYGTWVGSVYASIYPEFADKVVLIGNLPPAPNAHDFSRDYAMNHQMVVAEFIDRCRKYTGSKGEECMTRDPEAAFYNLTAQLAQGLWSTETHSGTVSLTPEFITAQFHPMLSDRSHGIGDLPEGVPVSRVLPYLGFGSLLDGYLNASVSERGAEVQQLLDHFCSVHVEASELGKCVDQDGNSLATGNEGRTCPVWKLYGVCPGGPRAANLAYIGVMSADTPTHLTPRGMVDLAKRLGRQFGLIGRNAGFIMDAVALWPGKVTYPGIGSEATPLIMGTTEDSATAFKWTQEMKLAFPFGKLMTFQGFFHGFHSAFLKGTKELMGSKGEWECFQELQKYLHTGVLPRNGFVCHVERRGVDPGNPAAQSLASRFNFLEASFRPQERKRSSVQG